MLLIHENIDQVKEPRSAWLYNAGQRRVRRAPNIAYDGPGTASDGLSTADDLDLFNGAPDRYNWELKGQARADHSLQQLQAARRRPQVQRHYQRGAHEPGVHPLREAPGLGGGFATLKEGARHIYARRTFYMDEDTWQISIIDHYDGRGELWKVKEGHPISHYQVKVPWLGGGEPA